MTEEPVLLCSDRNGVRTLTLNRPHRKNAINRDLWIALQDTRAQAVNFATVDAAEAYAAVAEKREPSFTGRWAVPRSERKDA